MIRVEKEEIEINGCVPDVMAEATLLLKKIRELITRSHGEECAEKIVHSAFVLSSKSDEELDVILNELLRDFFGLE